MPVSFTLPIRAQQVSDPVAEQFSLNTSFVLLSKKDLWLADSNLQIQESSDVAFPEGRQYIHSGGNPDKNRIYALGK